MFRSQRRVQQLCRARILAPLTYSVALLFAIASNAIADPAAVLNGLRSVVSVGSSAGQLAGGSELVTLPPALPLNVTSPLTFNFNVTGNLLALQSGTPAQQAAAANVINGFVQAGDRWRSYFADPITVNIDIDFGPIGNGVLGGTSNNFVAPTYASVRTALAVDAKSADDAVAVSNLQTGPSMQFMTNNTAANTAPTPSPRVRDNDVNSAVNSAAGNNDYLGISRANAKALGISVGSGSDANITFTDFSDYGTPFPTNWSWDFDPSNGISANTFDFVGVATHEIGHVMGFESGVDYVDYFGSANGPGRLAANGGPLDLNPYAVFTALDLYRFSANSLSQPSQPVGGLMDLAMGQFNAGSRPYFSINGGATNLGTFSTGSFNGDGRQASHWQDGLGLGIMDPTFGTGELGVVTLLDRRAMDVIGWDPQPVPEPAGLALILAGALGLWLCRTRSGPIV